MLVKRSGNGDSRLVSGLFGCSIWWGEVPPSAWDVDEAPCSAHSEWSKVGRNVVLIGYTELLPRSLGRARSPRVRASG